MSFLSAVVLSKISGSDGLVIVVGSYYREAADFQGVLVKLCGTSNACSPLCIPQHK